MSARAWVEPRWRELSLPGDPDVWLARCGLPLAEALAERARRAGRVLRVGVAGAQGTGKSTACQLLVPLLERGFGLRAVVLALDDFYLPRAERARLARELHPLFATRGVPGTHELPLLAASLQALSAAEGDSELALPRFDKARDERAPEPRRVRGRFDLVLLEGWCVGARPESEAELAAACNALEAAEDADGRFRRRVNEQLAGPYTALFSTLDALVYFAAPDFSSVHAFRGEQEAPLRRAGGGMDAAQLSRFIAHFERITRHMLRELPGRADILVQLDASRQVTSIRAAQIER